METNGAQKSAEVQFEAMLVNLEEVDNNEDRFITAGLEYGDSAYIWVGQAAIKTKTTMKKMNVSVNF